MSVPAQPSAPTAPAASTAAPSTPGQSGAPIPVSQGPDATQTSSPGGQEQSSRGPDFFRMAFAQVRGYRQPAEEKPAPQAPNASPSPDPKSGQESAPSAKPASERKPRANGQRGQQNGAQAPSTTLTPGPRQNSDGTIVLTQDELNRRIQAETDRRFAKMQQDTLTRQQREELKQLRRDDPLEYVRRVEQMEAEQETGQQRLQDLNQHLDRQLQTYDREILDPLLGSLPLPVREKVIKASNPQDIQGRAVMAKNALEALRTMWMTEGRNAAKESLMNDQTFIKEVLARYGGGPREEPESSDRHVARASDGAQVDGNAAMNGWMRSAGRAARTTSGRAG